MWLDQNGDNQCVYVVVITISLIILVQKKLIVKSPECFPTEGSQMRRPDVFMQSVILLLWQVETVKWNSVGDNWSSITSSLAPWGKTDFFSRYILIITFILNATPVLKMCCALLYIPSNDSMMLCSVENYSLCGYLFVLFCTKRVYFQ